MMAASGVSRALRAATAKAEAAYGGGEAAAVPHASRLFLKVGPAIF